GGEADAITVDGGDVYTAGLNNYDLHPIIAEDYGDDSEKSKYELLCKDNTRAPIDNYKNCHLARVPAHAVITRKDPALADLIWNSLNGVQNFNLFSSEAYAPAKNLMFKDSTQRLVKVPPNTDSFLYLGAEYISIVHSLRKEQTAGTASSAIRWCAVGHAETEKCDTWSINSVTGDSASIECQNAPTTASSYYAVAVVKKSSGVTWANLKGKKSCHTGIGRTAGWNIPMGRIYSQTHDCNFAVGDEAKCKASANEQYYGYAGAFRCLVEGAGDVAFIKHSTVEENSNGNGPEWARGVNSADYQLICPGKDPVPVNEFTSCHLAVVPAHAVVTRPEIRDNVVRILQDQQTKFGVSGSDSTFKMFQSSNGNNLLFKDSTKCLQEIPAGRSYEQFLGPEYMSAMSSLRQCTDTASDLEKSCTFHTCQQP
ncbi:hypothetical protein GOODEAATRI_012301, partial [Goodea atripinnis]